MTAAMRSAMLVLGACLAAAVTAAEGVPVVEVSDLTPGVRGVCLTEMDGGEMVEIPVTVLGVMAAATPEGETVLVRLDDPRFEDTGIIAGMSGSPVYVDGALLGALAFGWPFSKEPIGGVTPFGRMLQLGQDPAPQPRPGSSGQPGLASLLDALGDGSIGSVLVDWLLPQAAAAPRALPLALSTGGLSPPGGWLAEAWQRLGWVAAAAGGAAVAPAAEDRPLVPGSMVAGLLATGDVTLSVGGTVTEVRGDKVWAFGHPFIGGGFLPMTLARARVVTVLPNLMSSFKFYSVGEPLGAFRVDRLHGVWGRLGETAPSVPLSIEVDGRSYRFDCMDHPVLLPLLAGYLTQGSLFAQGRQFGDQTVRVRVEGRLADGAEVALEETFASPDGPALAAGTVTMLLAYLEGSGIELPPVAEARVRLDSAERTDQIQIVEAVPQRRVVRPGERLGVHVRLRSWRGEESSQSVEIQVPAGTPRGRLDVVVADGASWTRYDLTMRPQSPRTAADVLRLLGRIEPSHRLVVALERADPGVTLPGGPISTPPSVQLALRSGLGGAVAPTTHRVVARTDRTFDAALSGGFRLPLLVRYDGSGEEGGEPVEETQ